jgi:catechol 2,3-dioxygenase-like lactoylglutathione lyase family enzyme
MNKVTHVSLLVSDQQEALDWYTEKLGWKVVADMPFPGDMPGRWVSIAPPGQSEIEVVLEQPEWTMQDNVEERAGLVGKSPGFVIATEDCRAETETLRGRGVQIISEPVEMPWGISMVFVDLYGHAHNLLQPMPME